MLSAGGHAEGETMFVRSIPRLAATGLAAGALTVALSVPAFAVPARDSSGTPVPDAAGVRVTSPTPNASGNITPGTDVASPDQQAPIPAHTKPIAASPPTWPENPQPLAPPQTVSASSGTGFQWDDAGIGAGGALVVALTALGGVWILRRRQVSEPPLAA
jgi:hypothetical protein